MCLLGTWSTKQLSHKEVESVFTLLFFCFSVCQKTCHVESSHPGLGWVCTQQSGDWLWLMHLRWKHLFSNKPRLSELELTWLMSCFCFWWRRWRKRTCCRRLPQCSHKIAAPDLIPTFPCRPAWPRQLILFHRLLWGFVWGCISFCHRDFFDSVYYSHA